jgi:hypothetical protein
MVYIIGLLLKIKCDMVHKYDIGYVGVDIINEYKSNIKQIGSIITSTFSKHSLYILFIFHDV